MGYKKRMNDENNTHTHQIERSENSDSKTIRFGLPPDSNVEVAREMWRAYGNNVFNSQWNQTTKRKKYKKKKHKQKQQRTEKN